MLGTGPDRRLLHDDAPRPARPRPRPGRLLAQRGARRGVPRALGHPRVRRPTWRRRSSTPTPTSSSSACRTTSTRRPSASRRRPARRSCARSRSGGPPTEARRMLETVEEAGVFGGYLEDLCYTPKTLKAIALGRAAARSATSPGSARARRIPGPHSAWFWDGRLTGGGAIIDLGCHCIEIIRNFVGKGNRPVEVLCHDRHARPPDRRRGQRDRADPVRVGRDRPVRGELDVPRRDGPARRGRRHPRHDLAQPLPADRLRDVHAPAAGGGYVAEKAETVGRLAVPGRRRGLRARLRRHVQRHVPRASTTGRDAAARRFYDGYVVNAVMDAATARRSAAPGSRSSCRVARRRRRRGSRRRPRRTRARSSSSARSCPTAGTS